MNNTESPSKNDLLIGEFQKHQKLSQKVKISKNYSRSAISSCEVISTTMVEIITKSGHVHRPSKISSQHYDFHYLVMEYPTLENPLVKIGAFCEVANSQNGEQFPESIVVIPIEEIESVKFGIHVKIPIQSFKKNKNKI